MTTFAVDSGSPPLGRLWCWPEQEGQTGHHFCGKGRLRTLSSTWESRKFKTRRYRNRTSTLSVLYPVRIWAVSIYLGVGYRVAYPGQGNARALTWDRRSRAPTSFRLTINRWIWVAIGTNDLWCMANEVENARKNLEADLSDNPYILDDPIGHAITYKKISLWVNQCHGENKKRIKKTKKTNEVWKS